MTILPKKPFVTLPEWGLFFYALLTAFFGWMLVWLGGLVTSHDAGMSVPDWPTSFGYNMFFLPISQWTGGVLYEHTHRLLATMVGSLTAGLMILLFFIDRRRWVWRLGIIAVLMVVAQALLGGLRVTWSQNSLGWVHGCLGQVFFTTLASIALVTSPWWKSLEPRAALGTVRRGWIKHVTAVTLLIFLQLGLGAAMRHAHAGLSITDFPTAYGSWWPRINPTRLAEINAFRVAHHQPPTSLGLIHLQMMHRLMAVLILVAVVASTVSLWKQSGVSRTLKNWSMAWSILVFLQVVLGAWTILSGRAADIATAHVAVGALLLMAGVVQILMARHWNQGTVPANEDSWDGAVPFQPPSPA